MKRFFMIFVCALLLTCAVHAAPAGCVALTFDDGPSGDNTEALLQMLKDRDVRATFFLCGYRIDTYPELPEKLACAGHTLGVHGYSHTCFDTLTPQELKDELDTTKDRILALTGQTPMLLRPPCGAWDDNVREASRKAGLTVILWSVDPEDWRCRDCREIARRVCDSVQNGSVILMHDMYQSSVDAAALLIDELRSRGYEFVTVPELAKLAGCELKPGDVFSQFSGAHPPESEAFE